MIPENPVANNADALPLRDIHLPDSILWWPPAPGWWILLLLLITFAVSICFYVRQRKKKKLSAVYLAKQELNRIEKIFTQEKDKSKLIKDLSELIRRLSISVFKRSESASLTGDDWLLFLDNTNGSDAFSNGVGRALIEAPYQSTPDYDEYALLQLIAQWIDSVQTKAASRNKS